jgi:hypothetical protein
MNKRLIIYSILVTLVLMLLSIFLFRSTDRRLCVISVVQVGVTDHWCSDVIASIALAALSMFLFNWLFRVKERKLIKN